MDKVVAEVKADIQEAVLVVEEVLMDIAQEGPEIATEIEAIAKIVGVVDPPLAATMMVVEKTVAAVAAADASVTQAK